MSRDEALKILEKPAISEEEAKHEFEFVANKLEIPVEELHAYFNQPNKTYKDYKNQESLFDFGAKILKFIGVERSIKR